MFARNFVAVNLENIDRNYRLSYSRQMGRRMSLRVAYTRRSRDPQGNTPFDENAYALSLNIDLNP